MAHLFFERFVAQRLLPRKGDGYARPLVRVATYTIALGVMVMVVAVCILRGFQTEIRQKVVGFGSHIVVNSYAMGNLYEETPIANDRPEVERIRQTPGVARLGCYAVKGGMVKSENQIQGVLLKGVESDDDGAFFAAHLVEGRLFDHPEEKPSNEVVVSQRLADRLEVGIGDKLRTYFWQGDVPRARALEVCGIYNTDLADFDEHYLLGDLRMVQRLNDWDSNLVGGYEVLVDDFRHLDEVAQRLLPQMGYDLTLHTVVDQNPALFAWLDLLDSNIVLLMVLMTLVCTVAIISALLIMMFERSSTIGVLKALGCTNGSLRRIFLLQCAALITKGILVGDAVAWLVCWLQARFQIVRLDSTNYMMEHVPVALEAPTFVVISIGSLVVCLLALLIPTAYISHIEPAKSIKMN